MKNMLSPQKADKKGERNQAGCCFPPEAEKTYDRSFAAFAKAWDL